MHTSIMENKLDLDYKELLRDVLENGIEKEDRTGTGTLSLFGKSIRHNMSDGFPVLTTKKISLKTVSTELKWFLKGDTNIKYLVENGCNIWTGDAYKQYVKVWEYDLDEPLSEGDFVERIKTDEDFARIWGELGPTYGKQWRSIQDTFSPTLLPIDQLKNLIQEIKKNPNSRRLLVSSWAVDKIRNMILPPCHYAFQCYVADGKLSLMWSQRSADLFLGVPFNISSYGMLLLLLCKETGYKPGELIGNFGDIHLYKNHLEQAKEQLQRKPFELPELTVLNVDILNGDFNYIVESYNYHPAIKAPLSN